MNTSLSFDRAASFYDRTRDLPEPIATQGIQAILEAAGPGAAILDVGTGTGRISVPLLRRGANLVGCDISPMMMAQLKTKYTLARLARADASVLPFPAHQFDAVTTCHVMHLVGPWREALREYRRVLKTGGVYINARTEDNEEQTTGREIKAFWEKRVAAYGASSRRPGVQSPEELEAEFLKMGATVKHVAVASFARSHTLRDVIDGIANNTHSHTWSVPAEILAATVRELRDWATRTYGPDYLDRTFNEESVFVLDVTSFDRG